MENRSPSLREKVRQLRRSFVEKVPLSVAEARSQCAALAHSPNDQHALDELYRAFHSAKGTAASFGLVDISAQGAAGEHLVSQYRDLDPRARHEQLTDLLGSFETLLDRILHLAQAARQADEVDGTVKTASFDMGDQVQGDDRKRVFICDDDDLQSEQVAAQLTCFGYSVTTFARQEALRAAVLASPPDAIIMDIMFPDGQSGTDVAASLQREQRAAPPVIFMSGRRDFDARLQAVQAGGEAYFTKPIKANELVETLDVLTRRQEPEPFRVLVVDDEAEMAAYHSFILEQVGMITRLLHEPSDILEVLADFKPDLVLMDMYMPKCTGRDLSQLVRQIPEFVSLPIVFLSSETNKVKQVSALRVGAEGFLTKPIQPEDLISAVAIRAERMRTLRGLMVRDSLTGLFNHTFMLQFIENTLAACGRDGGRLCVAMIDVDHFKSVNDTYGHPVGDQVLTALSRLLNQRLRTSDAVGRYGGEEFVVVLRDVSDAEALHVIDTLRQDFTKIHFQAGDRDFCCTFSGGIASFPQYSTLEQLMEAADHALYVAKSLGRNRILPATEDERTRHDG